MHRVLGVGTGERDKNQRVNVDDGTEAVGTVDYLVHQTVHFPQYFIVLCGTPPEGQYDYQL